MDYRRIKEYLPRVHRTRQMDEELRESYCTLKMRLFHEGRIVTPSFISEKNMLPFFQAVGLEPFITLNEPICPRFVVEFYHSLEVKKDEELRPYIEFKLDQLMLRVFSISLTGAASHWLRNKPTGSIKTWEDLKTKFLKKYCPPGRTAKKIEEINNFQQEPDETLYQAWERVGNSELLLLVLIYYYWFKVDATAKD
ncbi:retrovirus-related pol polyprotein from transposon TNT 1-94 [Tanacetum coccineum]|uniref:Retrovirus-related pol polyprotein from transposon TNT 1-94 n=1 Tax=Tanacetum coccineum TaxID=301880 RepID=A0ABQ5BI88_9ASTR